MILGGILQMIDHFGKFCGPLLKNNRQRRRSLRAVLGAGFNYNVHVGVVRVVIFFGQYMKNDLPG